MLKLFSKTLIRIKNANFRGLLKNPLFYFGLCAVLLFGSIYTSCSGATGIGGLSNTKVVFLNSFFNQPNNLDSGNLFSSQTNAIPLETPDLKIIQDNAVYAVSAPSIVSAKVLGDVFGGSNQAQKQITNYTVQPGDTVQSIAASYNISSNTILWANGLTNASALKVGQDLTILPVDGVLHVVKSGDIMSAIAQKYKANSDDIISFNSLANQDDIYIGDILIVPGGVMPKTAAPITSNNQVPVANNYFIFPAQGIITQGLHYYNAIDLANKCGTPVYAAAAGVVERAVYNNSWNLGMGNYVTVLHPNGMVTYYGHFEVVFVKPGDKVNAGDRIGLMGETGNATGCHVHFEVIGGANPLAQYPVGTKIHY